MEENTVYERIAALVGEKRTLSKASFCDLPDTLDVKNILDNLKKIVYPSFFSDKKNEKDCVSLVEKTYLSLERAIFSSFAYLCETKGEEKDCKKTFEKSKLITDRFFAALPDIRDSVKEDVEATLKGDPAATSADIIILGYPGIKATFAYRLAHVLNEEGVPVVPRMMTEIAHSETGIDIHPGAKIGRRFVIDHGTGIVIGETTVIGDDVNLYQGVTLGAISLKDARSLVGVKRHPTIENGVTVYAGATILGGKTVIGERSVIGSSVFITESVPPYTTVTLKKPELKVSKHNA